MIKFEELVNHFIAEADANDDKEAKEGISGFLNSNNVYNNLKKAYEDKYTNKTLFPFPGTANDLVSLAEIVATSYSRSVKDPTRYQNLLAVYPILDLLAQLYQIYKKGGSKSGDAANSITNAFVEQLKDPNVSDIPMEFPARTPWVKDIKKEHYASSRQDLGKARLDLINQNLSIYSTILYLLSIRRESFKLKIPVAKLPPADNFIRDIFFNPQVYLSGKKPMPDEKIQALYNEITSELLLKISNASYQLFLQQAGNNLGIDSKTSKPNFKDEPRAYAEFLGTGALTAAKEMNWQAHKKMETASTSSEGAASPIMSSFDQSFELLTNELLSEKDWLPSHYGEDGDVEDTSPSSDATPLKPFEKQQGQFVYDLEGIKTFRNEIPQANNLYDQLTNLANYIQKESSIDWLGKAAGVVGGASKIAKGLSLGVGPSMDRK